MSDLDMIALFLKIAGFFSLLAGLVVLLNLFAREAIYRWQNRPSQRVQVRAGRLTLKDQDQ